MLKKTASHSLKCHSKHTLNNQSNTSAKNVQLHTTRTREQ